MHAITREVSRLAAGAALAVSLNACEGGGSDTPNVVAPVILPNTFTVTRLTGDDASQQAAHVDANLVNPWGISFDSTGVLWSANNSTGTSTLHTATGAAQPLVVRIPSDLTITGGSPTGIAVNLTSDFAIAGSGPAAFIFVSEDGLVTAWNDATESTAMRVASRVVNRAMYTAATIASYRAENHLYATNFRNNAIDVFDARFTYAWSFTDKSVPEGYAPYGIQNIAGKLYVAFALRDAAGTAPSPGAGNGIVVVFNPDGSVARRFAANGQLDAPWGMVVAPPEFGPFAGKILISNYGDGKIGAYHPDTGMFIDVLRDGASNPLIIDGLRGLTFGPGMGSTTLFFSAGPGRETHGVLGTITP